MAAREQFLDGARLSEQGRWAEAKQRYEASMTLHPHATTLFNIAYCERELGELGSAWWKMKRSLGFGVGSDAALSPERRAHAEHALAEVEAGLAVVEVAVAEGPIRLSVSGRSLGTLASADGVHVVPTKEGESSVEQSGTFDLVLEPGAYEVRIETKHGDRRLTLDVVAGGRSQLELGPIPEERAQGVRTSPPAPLPEQRRHAPAAALPDDGAISAGKWAAFAVGVIGVGVGIGAGVNAYWMNDELSRDCATPTNCPEASRDDIEAMETSALVSDVGWIVAAAGFGTGVALWLLESDADGPSASVVLSPRSAEVNVRF